MSPTSLQIERLVLANSTGSRVARNLDTWDRLVATFTDSEFSTLVMICAIGLILTLVVALVVPNFAATMAPLQPFL